jgi:segregation and condensation protein A
MTCEVRLECFEGPLDLLLHLIHRNEVSITDIPIALITGQYLEALADLHSLNLDVAGEYLVMAAYLTHIKSQMLLPAEEDLEQALDQSGDPRDELVAHLLEYKRYKEVAMELDSLPMLGREIFVREIRGVPVEQSKSEQFMEVGIQDLVIALRDVLERIRGREPIEIEPERILVKDKIRRILERLGTREWITFGSLFDEDSSRLDVLTTFLALLETVKMSLVSAYQDAPYGTILISRSKGRNAGMDSSYLTA